MDAKINNSLYQGDSDRGGVMPQVARLAILEHVEPAQVLVGREHILDSNETQACKKISVAIHEHKVLVSIGDLSRRQHWQLLVENGAALHSDAPSWFDPQKHTPLGNTWAHGSAFIAAEGRVLLRGESLLLGGFSEVDCEHLVRFLERVLREDLQPRDCQKDRSL